LTVEGKTIQKSSSGSGQGHTVVMAGGNQPNSSRTETISYFRFCFDKLLADQAQSAMDPDLRDYIKVHYLAGHPEKKCGGDWDPVQEAKRPQPDTLDVTYGKITYRIKPRSAFGIFEFLGAVIKLVRDHPQPFNGNVITKPQVLEPPILRTAGGGDQDIFRVMFDVSEDCFVTTTFNGTFYCIPKSASNTKRIFNLLAQLIAIETAATDLSITPTVRIVQ
jgi:hypothetical protein